MAPNGDMNSSLMARARAHGGACKERGAGLTDEQIYTGFELLLNESIRGLKRWLGGRTKLIVRSCHSGTQLQGVQKQPDTYLWHTDRIIRRVAAEQCLPVLDVWALDREAGYYSGGIADIHVPQVGSMQAAVAALFALTDISNELDIPDLGPHKKCVDERSIRHGS